MRSATRCGWLSGLKLMKMMLAEGAAHSGLIDRDFINDYRDSAAQFVDPRLRRSDRARHSDVESSWTLRYVGSRHRYAAAWIW